MNVYLDIDGVLLVNENYLAEHAEEFIQFLVKNYNVHWLTTHCMNGDPRLAVKNVGKLCSAQTVKYLKRIKPTKWQFAKTEAIDFSNSFLWFDDDLYPEEKEELLQHNALESHVRIDIYSRPHHLSEIIMSLKV